MSVMHPAGVVSVVYNAEDQYKAVIRLFERLRKLATDGQVAPATLRFEGRAVLVPVHVIGADARDTARDFFVQCYHLKDYLKKDTRITEPDDVEKWITQSRSLALAADLCNSSKHAGLDGTAGSQTQTTQSPATQTAKKKRLRRQPRSTETVDKIHQSTVIDFSAGAVHNQAFAALGGTTVVTVGGQRCDLSKAGSRQMAVITISGKEYGAVDLAGDCIRDWDLFLQSQGLTFPKA